MEKTTIQINKNLLERLKLFKRHERESYGEVINYLLDKADNEELSIEEIEAIQEGLEDIKQGRVKSIEQVAKEMGINLR